MKNKSYKMPSSVFFPILIICALLPVFTLAKAPQVREFRLKYSENLFTFPIEKITRARSDINSAISEIRENFVKDATENIKLFATSNIDIPVCHNELYLSSSIATNSEKFFSMRIDILAYSHGENGCQSEVVCLNFAIDKNGAHRVNLFDIIKPEYKLQLMKTAVEKLRNKIGTTATDKLLNCELEKLESPKNGLRALSETLQFTVNKNGITIIFPPYSIACGALGILSAEIPFTEAMDMLSPKGTNLLKQLSSK